MAQARDEAGNVWEVDAQGNAVRLLSAANSPTAGTSVAPDPAKVAEANQQAALRDAQIRNANRQGGNDAFTQGNANFDNQAKLRTEFNGLPAVKDYRESFTQLMAALKSAPNGTGDNALIYAYAKVMDPGSVVRESEMTMAGSGDSSINSIGARLKKQFGIEGGGNLSEKVRRDLKLAINTKVAQFAKSYGEARQWYQQQARANGFDPDQVVGPAPAQPYLKDYERLIGGLTGKNEAGDKAIPGIATKGGYSTPDDRRIAGLINGAFKRGASFDDLQAMAKDAGIELGPEHRANVELRDSGKPVNEFLPGESGQTTDVMSALGNFAETPVGTAAASYLNAGGFGLPQLITGDAPFEAMRAENGASAMAGDILGGITGTGLATKGLMKAGLGAPKAATAANLGFGSLFVANYLEDDRLKGAGIGLGASVVGDTVGKRLLAPIITRALDTAPAAAAASAITPAVNKARGMFGRAPSSLTPPRPIDVAEGAIGDEVQPRLDDILSTLGDAQRLGLPFSLADADPALRQSLGSAARISPDVRSAIGGQLQDRSLGQADRALTGINSSLSAPVSMSDTANAIRTSARAKAGPLYDQAFAMPAPANLKIDDILETPSGQKAARSAYDIALDRGVSPAEAAMALNPDGSVRIDASPTYQTLDFMKKGFDQTLGAYRNPMTGKLDLEANPAAQGVEGLRQKLVSEMDAGNPIYRDARATYAAAIKPRTSLQTGYNAAAPNVTQDQFGQAINGLGAPEMGTFKQGYSTSMADRINKTRLSANPYDIVAGTPDQQAKLTALYPEAADFLRKRELERLMADTSQEVLGGSPTQGRTMADQRFMTGGPNLGDAAEIGASLATGIPPVGVATRVAASGAKGMFGRRAQAKAAERAQTMAPILYNPDPATSAMTLQALLDDIARRRSYQTAVGNGAGMIGSASAVGAAPLVFPGSR